MSVSCAVGLMCISYKVDTSVSRSDELLFLYCFCLDHLDYLVGCEISQCWDVFVQKMLHQLHPVDLGTSGQNSTPRVKYFILKKPLKLTDIFKHFNITPLRPIEEAFILEYVKVMAPVAAALDILQGDKNISIGYLLPTLTVLQTQLEKLKRNSGIKHCKALINALCNGLTKRFSHMFLDRELRLAAMLHPRFKLFWIQEDKDDAIEMLKEEFEDECERSGSQRPPTLFKYFIL